MKKKTSIEWCKELDVAFNLTGIDESHNPDDPIIEIFDADGWDRKNFEKSFREPITEDEFRSRCAMSTAKFHGEHDELMKFFEGIK